MTKFELKEFTFFPSFRNRYEARRAYRVVAAIFVVPVRESLVRWFGHECLFALLNWNQVQEEYREPGVRVCAVSLILHVK